jgi:uncharacterized membrane protein (UPF0136 family)
MKTVVAALLTGVLVGPVTQLVCYLMHMRSASAAAMIFSAIVGIIVATAVLRAVDPRPPGKEA